SACFRLGPDPRRALGPAAKSAAQTGRTRDRTRPMLQQRQKVLAKAPSTRGPKRTLSNQLTRALDFRTPGVIPPAKTPYLRDALGTKCQKMHLGIARTGIGDMSAHDEYLPLTMIETQLSRSDEFRRNAAACEQLAEHAIYALAKQTFRKLVAQWRRLADLA